MMRSDHLILAGVVAAGAAASILYTTREKKLKDATMMAHPGNFKDERSPKETLAMALVAKADRKLKGYSFLGGMGAKYDDAAELLESAGNNFKLAKAWKEAGDTYLKLAEVHVKQMRCVACTRQ
ncbi:hypothetical protein ABBQ38_014809 [Trebouxia sp. C0009 RCD-2024]